MCALRSTLIVALLLAMLGCSVRTTKPVAEGPAFKVLALLPVAAPANMARERAEYIQQALFSELKSAGFYVLEPELTAKECGGAGCPKRQQLAKDFGAEAFLQLSLDSISRNNFVAGYYNSIKGTIGVSDRDNQELFKFKHAESEKGGLLFNTGQIFQGIKSQIENSDTKSSEILADNFVKSLVARLPEPQKEPVPESTLNIARTSLKQIGKGIYNVCAEASPAALAYLILARDKPTLREVKPGLYCANFALGPKLLQQDRNPQIELRSALGSVVRSDLPGLKSQPLCDLEGIVQVASGQPENKLFFRCEAGSVNCQERLQRCMGNSYIVYRSPNPLGPYMRVGKFNSKEWVDPTPSGQESSYALVATNAEGFRSKPVSAEKVKTEKS